jgi:hypothetical protein
MEVKITLIKRISFSKIRNAKLIALLTVIFIGGSVGAEAQTTPFPADVWDVYGWTQFTKS